MTGTTLAILFDLGILAFLAWQTRDLVLQYRTWRWTETPCRITGINHGEYRGSHLVQPTYRYTFEGKGYTGHDLHRGEQRSFYSEHRAQKYGEELKRSARTAWVDPTDPTRAVLYRGIPSGDMLRWIGTACFAFVVTLAILLRG